MGISIRELEKRSRVSRGVLSMAENGRLLPTADEYDAVMAVLHPDSPLGVERGPTE